MAMHRARLGGAESNGTADVLRLLSRSRDDHESRLEVIARRTVGVGAANFGFIGCVSVIYNDNPLWVDLIVLAFCAGAFFCAGVWMWSRRLADGLGARVFCIWADVGTLFILLTFTHISDALVGAALFSVVGMVFLFFLPRPWLLGHVLFAAIVVVTLSVLAVIQGGGVAHYVIRGDIVLSTAIGPTLTMELAWRKLRERAELAGMDPLTGVKNLRGMWRELIPVMDHARRDGDTVAIAVGDIDGFKLVNDVHGHDMGDRVLVEVAERLSSHVDGMGFVARSGGEEFTVVVHGPNAEEVMRRAASIPTRLGGQNSPPVTMSVGVTSALPFVAGSVRDAARDAHRAADRTMYEQKRRGGDGVKVRT